MVNNDDDIDAVVDIDRDDSGDNHDVGGALKEDDRGNAADDYDFAEGE